MFASCSAARLRRTSKTSASRSRRRLAKGREPILDCEHFFDGFKANHDYALSCAAAAYAAGARYVVLCDTNGGTLPHEIARIVEEVAAHVPGSHLGIHAHDDTGNAVANSLAAVRAGARHIQGALNGLGERCGNANLVSLIPTLLLKRDFAEQFEIGVTPEKLATLTKVSHTLDELLNRAPNRHAPYVGASAFATKAGIHASAVMKEPKTYEHIVPEAVGNKRRLLVSDQAGKSNILAELERIGVRLDKDDSRLARVLDEVKEKESLGYAYEGADASFELLARRILGQVPDYFEVERFRVDVERRHNAQGELVSVAEAVVKVRIDGETLISAAEGEGPVNALDLALRKDLGKYQRFIEDLELVDFRVRIFQWRNRRGDAGVDRVSRRLRRKLVDGRRLRQYHRRLVSGADRRDHLQAFEIRRAISVTGILQGRRRPVSAAASPCGSSVPIRRYAPVLSRSSTPSNPETLYRRKPGHVSIPIKKPSNQWLRTIRTVLMSESATPHSQTPCPKYQRISASLTSTVRDERGHADPRAHPANSGHGEFLEPKQWTQQSCKPQHRELQGAALRVMVISCHDLFGNDPCCLNRHPPENGLVDTELAAVNGFWQRQLHDTGAPVGNAG